MLLRSKIIRNTTITLVALVLSSSLVVIYFSLNRFQINKIENKNSSTLFRKSIQKHSKAFDINYDYKKSQILTFEMKSGLEQQLYEIDSKFQSGDFPKNLHDIVSNLEDLNANSSLKNDEILWRLGKAYYHLADLENELKHSEKGIKYCEMALESGEKNFNVHKWYAKVLTWNIKNLSLREQIKFGNLYKKHTKEAVQLNQKDTTLHFMLGEYYFRLAEVPAYQVSLGWFFFSDLPTGTYSDALGYLLNAYKIDPNLKHVNLFLAKTYISQRNLTEAKIFLSQAEKLLRTKTFTDRSEDYHFNQTEIDSEIKSLFTKYC